MTEKDYSATPLWKKLGIREGHTVAIVGAERSFATRLDLPAGAEILAKIRRGMNVILLFATRRDWLERRFATAAEELDPSGGLWVAWPKKTTTIETDLTFDVVQRTGLEAGLVDNKSCSIDENWQALRFVYRLKDRPGR